MQPPVGTERDRLRANIDGLAALLQLADRLRRTTPAKWDVTPDDWQAAVQAVITAPVPHPGDAVALAEAIRTARSAGGRLGDSGEARLGSASVGRHPDGSRAGKRFYEDLESAHRRLTELRELARAEHEAHPPRRSGSYEASLSLVRRGRVQRGFGGGGGGCGRR